VTPWAEKERKEEEDEKKRMRRRKNMKRYSREISW